MSLFDTGIRPSIDEFLLEQSKELRNYGDYWSASSAGYCMRKLIFERLGLPQTEDARKTRVFASGHIFHQFIQDITKGAGLSVAQELELQDETLMIRGHVDDIINIDGHLILYDYKTAHSRSFTYSKARPEMGHYHRMQLGTYMYMLKDWENVLGSGAERYPYEELSEARRMSISKDDLRMDEKQLLWSPELEKDILDYWTTLNNYWKERKLPPCTCADYDGGFMANEKYNPYWLDGEPCSLKLYKKWKEEKEENATRLAEEAQPKDQATAVTAN